MTAKDIRKETREHGNEGIRGPVVPGGGATTSSPVEKEMRTFRGKIKGTVSGTRVVILIRSTNIVRNDDGT